MDRKSLIWCLVILGLLVLGTGVAVALLYSDIGSSQSDVRHRKDDVGYEAFAFVPSDALMVGGFSDPACLCADFDFGDKVSSSAFSLHYSGKLTSLYVFELKKGLDESGSVVDVMEKKGCSTHHLETDSGKNFLIASESETLVKAACRHWERGISICDDEVFSKIASSVSGDAMLYLSNEHLGRLLPLVVNEDFCKCASFLSGLSDWVAIGFEKADDSGLSLKGLMDADDDPSYYMEVLQKTEPAVSGLSEILPSFTVFAASLPMRDVQSYISAYRSYLDSHQNLQKSSAMQKGLAGKLGISPDDFMRRLDVREAGIASFMIGKELHTVNLLNVAEPDLHLIFKGTDITSLKEYEPAAHAWPYSSFAASSFGRMFSRKDESCFTYIDGWIVSGSLKAVEEFIRGRSYDLKHYMADAGCGDMLAEAPASFVGYFSMNEDRKFSEEALNGELFGKISALYSDRDYCPIVLHVGKSGTDFKLVGGGYDLLKTEVPAFSRDTVVVIPEGPFKVTNCHTGKTNLFYQNSNNALCLRDENGKDVWGVPFSQKICGTVHDVDYYGNGKIQFLFGAGTKIYLIDRLSSFVRGFPLDLGKEILLGPDVYDFSGAKKYNIMVLHKDNTIDMYNMKGIKHASWKGISVDGDEVIKELPERIIVGGNNFWVVRTSIQKLIFPFYGGTPLTVFEGNQKIRPDSEVKVLDATSVEVSCYDGKVRTVKLK